MLKRFFLLCSGADIPLLNECSHGEQNKYVGIGATVFFTAVMAAIAASYALYTVFDQVLIAVFFGLVWGLLIFNLDRFIVSTMRKKESFKSEFLQALPRLILALIIAMVISKPLELKIFDKEIQQVLLEEKNEMTLNNQQQIAQQFTPQRTALQTEIERLKEEITAKETEVNNLYETYISEAEGRKGTKKVGKGPVYKEKRAKHDQALADLAALKKENQAKIATKEAAVLQLQQQEKNSVTNSQPIIDNFGGFMARINALNKLPWLPSFFIFLLFLAIETAPIFAKLISAKSEYDLKYQNREDILKNWILQQEHQRSVLLATDTELNNKVYRDLQEEEAIYQQKQQMARKLIQAQTDSFLQNHQKVL
ncbi:conserved membrane hypothetical protein [Tenacibaculum litopenaei]|uniref:DUF4407 domain-containing protein n=1 Tax=Tenacibaculum litopenaei TaxID=396016 RepID=UPI003893FC30